MVSGIAATIGAAYSQGEASEQPRTNVYRQLRGTFSSFEVGQQSSALVHVYAIIDPLSESAQKIGPLLKMVTELSHTFVHVQLNPQLVTEEIPLKRFYRYAVETKPSFTIEGEFAAAGASFADLPSDPILTLGIDVPHSWLVSPRRSVHDLDNLKLDAILSRQDSPVIDLNFELEQFVIDGHATEGDSPSPPRGLQLQLSSLDGQPIGDTMVMANLGYLQFKANPGVMALGIRDARGREVYSLKSVSSGSTVSKPSPAGLANIYLTSFTGVTIRPVLTRNPGMEQADVLNLTPAPQTGSVFSKVVSS
jgi:UDP-glucose:glycoprotein glucosyltransferase